MAIAESPSLKPGRQVIVLFRLPGRSDCFTFESEVCWYDESGRAGLRSLAIPSEQRSTLQNWLGAKLEEDSARIGRTSIPKKVSKVLNARRPWVPKLLARGCNIFYRRRFIFVLLNGIGMRLVGATDRLSVIRHRVVFRARVTLGSGDNIGSEFHCPK